MVRTLPTILLGTGAALLLGLLGVPTPFAHAESVVWNQTYIERLCGPGGPAPYTTRSGSKNVKFCKWFKAENPNVSVRYGVTVTKEDTGEIVPSGSEVPQDTRLRYAFKAHEDTDINWFLTGFAADSPYGEWNAGAPILDCVAKDLVYGTHLREYAAYAPFAVTSPAKNISGLDTVSCTTVGANKSCTMSAPGTYTAAFVFSPTDGRFYGRGMSGKGCFGMQAPLQTESQQDFIVQVPQQTIPHTIIVTEAPQDPNAHTPTTPTLSTGGACTVGEPHSISMVSTDPDGDTLRYGIDWDNNGSVDQWVPPSGYVASGESRSASRTYSTAGQKTVSVLAQDEGGLSSSWATTSFSCTDSATAGLDENNNGNNNNDNNGGTFLPPTPDLDIRAIPSLVRQGNTTQVNWSATNVQSCTVRGTNGDSWSGTESPIGGETSAPITGQTTYTLTCTEENGTTHAERATVNVIPGFEEV